MPKMTLGQWRQTLGDAVALEEAPARLNVPAMQLLRGVNTGKVPLYTFRAADGRVFRMVKASDVKQYQASAAAKPVITIDGMKAAFKQMAES